jgi:hypothetical protein
MNTKNKFMRSKIIACFILAFLSVNTLLAQEKPNTRAGKTHRQVSKMLFNGKDLEGWTAVGKNDPPDSGWVVEDGILMTKKVGEGHGSDIITKDEYSNFDLSVDFKLSEGGNSGIKYFFTKYDQGGWLGLEYQILDNVNHPDAKNGRNGNRLQATLYDMLPLEKQVENRVGEWNHARIVVKGSKVSHYLNGVKVLSFDRNSEAYREAWKLSKFKDSKPPFGAVQKGHILLQDHGDEIAFKNIKIKTL